MGPRFKIATGFWRLLGRHPLAYTVVVLALGAGLALTGTVFDITDQLVMRRLPVKQPDRLVTLSGAWTSTQSEAINSCCDKQLRAAAFYATTVSINVRGDSFRVPVQYVSDNYFEVIGLAPELGTVGFANASGTEAVVTYDAWIRRFNRSREVVGTVILINSVPTTIVGVASPGFRGVSLDKTTELFVPTRLAEAFGTLSSTAFRQARWLTLFARLRSSNAISQVQADLNANDQLRSRGTSSLVLRPTIDAMVGSDLRQVISRTLSFLWLIAGIGLSIATLNGAMAWLLTIHARRFEFAVRRALGATWPKIFLQLTVEAVWLCAIAAAVALICRVWIEAALASSVVSRFLPASLLVEPSSIGTGFVVGVSLLFALLAPAVAYITVLAHVSPSTASLAPQGQSTHRKPVLALGITFELALSIAMMVTAIEAGAEARAQAEIDPGFDIAHVIVLQPRLAAGRFSPAGIDQLYRDLSERTRALAGVEHVTVSLAAPLQGFSFVRLISAPSGEQLNVAYNKVEENYFQTMGIPVLQGSALLSSSRPIPVVVNEALAGRLQTSGSVVGSRLTIAPPGGGDAIVVGVSKNTKYESLVEDFRQTLYMPANDLTDANRVVSIRTSGTSDAILPTVKTLASQFANANIETRTMRDIADRLLDQPKAVAYVTEVLAGIATLLVLIGLCATTALAVAPLRRSIALRLALGASEIQARSQILVDTAIMVAGGAISGLVLTVWLRPILETVLGHSQAHDWLTISAVSAIFVVVGFATCVVVVRASSNVEPAELLRDTVG